ncbi:acyltransferase family protein [Enterobacterales bacterium BD_CKDN230030183-1A_HGKHYDSX7]
MLGYLRFSLALVVSLNHLWMVYGVGRLAVFSFYVISGYLMTAILVQTYGLTAQGIRRYAVNRILRIYPSYLIVFILSAVAFSFFDRPMLAQFDPNISSPASFTNWLMNLTLFGLDFFVTDRAVPPSWTLFVEIFYYGLIPILLVMGRRFIFGWLVISIAYHLWLIISASPTDASFAWADRYGTVWAGGLGFAIGASAKLYMPTILTVRFSFLTSLVVFFSCYALSAFWGFTGLKPSVLKVVSTLGYYGAMFSAAPIVDYLAKMKRVALSEKLGEYSYPFYLVHIPIGFFVFYLMGAEHKNLYTLSATVGVSLIACWVLVQVDRRLSQLRSKIRRCNTMSEAELNRQETISNRS